VNKKKQQQNKGRMREEGLFFLRKQSPRKRQRAPAKKPGPPINRLPALIARQLIAAHTAAASIFITPHPQKACSYLTKILSPLSFRHCVRLFFFDTTCS